MSINRVMISGNLTRDPELRQTTGGTAVLSLGVAVNDRRRNQQTGEWEDYPNFVDCTIFGTRAESLSRYLSKGTKVAIDGRLRQDRWQDKQTGQNRSRLEVIVDNLDFMSSRNSGGNGGYRGNDGGYQNNGYQSRSNGGYQDNNGYDAGQNRSYTPAPQPAAAPSPAVDGSVYDEDIPF